MGYGWGNFDMCMRDCDRREDSEDRQMCRSRCYNSMSGNGYFNREDGFERSYGSGSYEMCMKDCDRQDYSGDRQMCRNRCFHSTSGSYDSYPGSFNTEKALASSYGRGNFETCMRDCDRREDSDDRQMCRNRCFDSMSGSYPGSYNKEETIARTYGSGNFQMSRCMDDCDRREDSDDRQMCRNRCFNSMSGRHPGSFNKEEAIANFIQSDTGAYMCVRSCGKITDGNERRKCQSDCMYGGKHFGYKEEAIGRSYGSGSYEMCMRNCDRRGDSNDRQRCRNICSSMSGRYYGSFNMQFGDFNREEDITFAPGSDFGMCMRNCDEREDSNYRQRCRNRCSSMFESGDFNEEEATAAQRFSREQMDRWMNEYKVADSDSSDDNHHDHDKRHDKKHHKHHHDDDSDSDSA